MQIINVEGGKKVYELYMKIIPFFILIVFLLPSTSFGSDYYMPKKCLYVVNVFHQVSPEVMPACIEELTNELNELHAQINESLKKIDKLNDKLLPLRIDTLHMAQDNLKDKLNDTVSEIELLKERINKLEDEVRALKEKAKRKVK
jgi:hypothetical protein